MLHGMARPSAVETDADGDILGIHQLDEVVEQLRRLVQPDPRVDVDVDDGKFAPAELDAPRP